MFKTLTLMVVVLVAFWLGWLARDISLPGATVAETSDISNLPVAITAVPESPKAARQAKATTAPGFKTLLLNMSFEQAVALYDEAVSVDDARAARYHAILLEYLQGRLDSGDAVAIIALMDIYLSRYYEDIEVLLVLAEFQRRQGYADEAARVFQQAFTYAYQPEQRQRVKGGD